MVNSVTVSVCACKSRLERDSKMIEAFFVITQPLWGYDRPFKDGSHCQDFMLKLWEVVQDLKLKYKINQQLLCSCKAKQMQKSC